MALSELFCGPISDAIGRKPVLYAGMALYLVSSLICYFAQTIDILLMGRFIQGFAVAGPYVSVISIVRDKYAGREMARIMSLVMMIFILVPAIAPGLGQAILYFSTWRTIFLMYIGLAIVISIWVFFRLEETLKPENRVKLNTKNLLHNCREILTNRITMSYTICMGICFGSFIGYLNSSQQIFQVQFQTGNMFALYFGILALVLGVAALVNSRIVEKLGMRYICIRSTIGIIIASGIFLAVNLLVPVTLWMFLIYAAALFFAFGLMFGNLNAISMEPMGHIAGIASAVTGSIASGISMLLGAVIGQLYDNTLIPVVTGFLVLGILSLGAMLYAEKSK